MKLYENIRARRIALKMTQQELAAKLGYKSTSTIAKIESGENDIPQLKIVAFARALETTPGALLDFDDDHSLPVEKPYSLSDQEQDLIEKYRKLNEAGKEYINEQLDFVLCRDKYKALTKQG